MKVVYILDDLPVFWLIQKRLFITVVYNNANRALCQQLSNVRTIRVKDLSSDRRGFVDVLTV